MFSFLGTIENPLLQMGTGYGGVGSTAGPVQFLSNILRLVSIGGGIFAFINVIISGIQYIGSGSNPEQASQALYRINMSLIGLIIIVGANIIAAIIGQVLFGSWTAILNPQIYGPGTP